MKALLYRLGATLFTAAAIVGLFTVTGFPMPVPQQVIIAVVSAAAVQIYIVLRIRRRQGQAL